MRRTSSFLALLVLLAASILPVAAEEEWMFDPTFREPEPGDVLHEGPPPLLRAQLDAFVDLFEAAFDVALTPERAQALRDVWEIAYGKGDAAWRDSFAALVAPASALKAAGRAGDLLAMETGLGTFRRALDARLTSRPAAPPHRLVRETLAHGREIAWPGEPAIPAAAADAWLEVVRFVVSLALNEAFEPTEGQAAALRADLAGALHALSPAARVRIRDVHRPWLRTEAEWDAADVARKFALRRTVLTGVADTLPPERRIAIGEPDDLGAYARGAAALAREVSAYDAWSNLARQPDLVLGWLEAWLGPPPQGGDHVLLYRP